jgi:hypothetical protein
MVAAFLCAGTRRKQEANRVSIRGIDCASSMLALPGKKEKRPGFHRAWLSILLATPAAIALRHP